MHKGDLYLRTISWNQVFCRVICATPQPKSTTKRKFH